ncbi:DUF72 domain-containing protein [bacterium]|nr:DUF72 domain-containing protein [bacterium]MCI0602025.1 DUF72 domain-containing protein [bacterium]
MAEYYFGIAGWSYKDWKGIVYPQDAPAKFDELGYLANFFDVIELNNTFYRIPESKMVESWVKRVQHNPRFQFTVKIYQGFTHEKQPVKREELDQFFQVLGPMVEANRLGPLLAQFPAAFKYTSENVDRLSELVESFRNFPLAVEFRHRSWIGETVKNWLEENQVSFCNVDEPIFRHHVKPSAEVTGPVGYVRLHGRNYADWYSGNRDARYNYLYSEEELDHWVPRIEEMGKKAKDVYVIGNNHFRGQAPSNILQLKSKTIREPVPVPDPLLKAFPELRKVASATKKKKRRGQVDLFDEES